MKNVVPTLFAIGVLALPGAARGAGGFTTTLPVEVQVSAEVGNLCVYTSSGFTASGSAVGDGSSVQLTLDYLATAPTAGSSQLFVKCTAQTALTPFGSTSGTVTFGPDGLQGQYRLTSQVRRSDPRVVGSADEHTFTLSVEIPAGQWGVRSGAHTGTVVYTLNYD